MLINRLNRALGSARRFARRLAVEDDGQGVPEYAIVTTVFVVILIVVLATLGDTIGEFLQSLVDQLPFGS